MHKIVISGYYGFNNIGDESILKAVIDNLRERLTEIDITVLSRNPASTAEKYQVHSVNRKSLSAIISVVRKCDLLISGGGSLLQDVSSKKSIIYYLAIMWIAKLLGKKVFIYSQGIGPIITKFNRILTANTLKMADGIVVRDEASKELLVEIGLDEGRIHVTADPVLRIKKANLDMGRDILKREGFIEDKSRLTVGWAIRERKTESNFVEELCDAMNALYERYHAQIVLIPFHYSEDMAVILKLKCRLGDKVTCIEHKYLTEEMLSIIGNMDVLVGVRLHSIIHAAIMDVPMIAISYDPKINSFMHSIKMKAMCSVYDFKSEFFMEEFEKTLQNAEGIKVKVQQEIGTLILKLNQNEDLIKTLLDKGSKK
jgi:polysaccharide pyruvyl transferase CsaB